MDLNQLISYFIENYDYVWTEFYKHFLMAFYGVLFAAIVGIPLGILIARYTKLSPIVFTIANVIQTVPPLALIACLLFVMSLGPTTVVFVLFLYSLLPIIRNTYTGIREIDKSLIESGYGMGMTRYQLLRMVQLPLSLSVIIAGTRTALVIGISVATIGAFIGSGGLGDLIVRGVNATDGTVYILAGALPAALMAVVADAGMGWLERALLPTSGKKLKKTKEAA